MIQHLCKCGVVISVLCIMLSACTMGIHYSYDENGVLTKKDPYLALGQMQTSDDAHNIDIIRLIGLHANYGAIGVDLGYGSHIRMILKPTTEGELPVMVIDSGINPFEKDGVTDTVLTGDEAIKGFYTDVPEDSPAAKPEQ